jgi:hypothetical protein
MIQEPNDVAGKDDRRRSGIWRKEGGTRPLTVCLGGEDEEVERRR